MQQRSTEINPEITSTTTSTLDYEKLTTNYNEEKDNKYRLVAEKYNVDKDSEKLTMLAMGAACKGYVRTLEYLLSSKKIDLNKELRVQESRATWHCTTLFIEAIREKQKGITSMLLENPTISPAILNVFGKTMYAWSSSYKGNALTYAINNEDLKLIDLLLKKGANPDAKANIGGYDDGTYHGSAMDKALEPNKNTALQESIIKIMTSDRKKSSPESIKGFLASFFKTASVNEEKQLSADSKPEATHAASPKH